MTTAAAGSSADARGRQERLQAAKKKLKTFRAKQAQIARRTSSSSASGSISSLHALKPSSGSSTGILATSDADAQQLTRRSLIEAAIKDADRVALRAQHDGPNDSAICSPHPSASASPSSFAVAAVNSRRHSCALSRSAGGPPPAAGSSRHGRGHSRTSSISISLKPGALGDFVPRPQQPQQPAALTASIASASGVSSISAQVDDESGPPVREARIAKRRSISVLSAAASTTTFVASTGGGHFRGHSRTGSRTFAGARPSGVIVATAPPGRSSVEAVAAAAPLGLKGHGDVQIVAVEHGPDITAASFMPANRDAWADELDLEGDVQAEVGGTADAHAAASASADAGIGMLTPSSSLNADLAALGKRASSSSNGSSRTSHSPQHQQQLSSKSLTPVASPSRAHAALLEEPQTPSALFRDLNSSNSSSQQQQRLLAISPWASPSTSPSASTLQFGSTSGSSTVIGAASKRLSRHNRRASVATKRESMEVMGGLLHGPAAAAAGVTGYSTAERRRSAARLSGIMPASALFGDIPPAAGTSSAGKRRSTVRISVQRDWNWQSAIAVNGSNSSNSDDIESRLSALDKLEGKSPSASLSLNHVASPEAAAAQEALAQSRAAPKPFPLIVPDTITHAGSNTQVPLVTLQGNTPTPGPNTAAANKQFMPGSDSAAASHLCFSLPHTAGGLWPPLLFDRDGAALGSSGDGDDIGKDGSTADQAEQAYVACVDQRGSRSSVQLPDFDELHGTEGMNKRASLSLLEMNEKATSSAAPGADGAVAASTWESVNAVLTMTSFGMRDALDSLASPRASHRLPSPLASPQALPLPKSPLAGSASSIGLPSTPTPSNADDAATATAEGLGTLVEEEEDEEDYAGSPSQLSALALHNVTADSPDGTPSPDADDPSSTPGPATSPRQSGAKGMEEQQQPRDEERKRREEELAQIKRNRRASALTPKPMKLKSRPASLFLAPSMRNSNSTGLAASDFSPTAGAGVFSSATAATGAATAESAVAQAKANPLQPPEAGTVHMEEEDSVGELRLGWSMAKAQRASASKVASLAGDHQLTSPPSSSIGLDARKRTWRMSMPAVAGSLSGSSAGATGAPQQRIGMRRLQLGSLNTALPSTVETSHSFASDLSSSSSSGSSGGIGGISIPFSSGSGSSNAGPVKRRSSIIYKSSEAKQSTPLIGSSASSGGFNLMRSSSSDSISSTISSSGIVGASAAAAAGGISAAAWDELKTRAQRDAALLDSMRRQLEAAQKELAGEKLRAEREYTDLERLMQNEKLSLAAKIQEAERNASARTTEAETAQAELQKVREALEETEAERDTYQEDVDGWRTRCADLEKKLASERSRAEAETRARRGVAAKVKRLIAQLEATGAQVSPEDQLQPEDVAPSVLDRVTPGHVSRYSPSSPMAPGASGYFSQSSAMPPPEQTVKLLADMRQQIFNLAGTLEHERRERAKAADELESLRAQSNQEQGPEPAELPQPAPESFHRGDSSSLPENTVLECEQPAITSQMPITTVSPGRSSRNKRHVFAYDSSTGSQEHSSASAGSQSLSNTTVSETPFDEESFAKAQAALAASEEDDSEGDFSLATGRGTLQTLDEVEEEEAPSDGVANESLCSDDATPVRPSIDVEGGAVNGDLHFDEDTAWDASSEVKDDRLQGPPSVNKVPLVALEGHLLDMSSPRSSDGRRSTMSVTMPSLQHTSSHRDSDDSSFDSQGPASPPNGQSGDMDDSDYEDVPEPFEEMEERPEFIPEWSFHKASKHALRRMAVNSTKRSVKHSKIPSVEDFFGIMNETTLPPLPSSSDALDMPPIHIDAVPFMHRYIGYGTRSSVRSASVKGVSGIPAPRYSPYDSFEATTRASMSESSDGGRQSVDSTSSYLSRATGILSGASVGRVSQGVTNAFSGLGGYLTKQDAFSVAQAGNSASQPHPMQSVTEEREPAMYSTKRRQDTGSSIASSASSTRPARQFVPRYGGPPLIATPSWELDFTHATGGAGSHPVIVL
ncbi:hypothetical protein K437DRAFT_266401 [Tilletiaria anomala UBC 951]|uniref:Uncharacterized protein n=1 Tax=Tilletiaria anomala (strain ATCC 24038 / CBS 436.72 / UBC 951) TaxID=1037660 RepID=A0A066WP06_TILAU|nr:uncharacterized protein K437DRAFT_266401 [Tilletiaria anomala UBC 951]KDN52739.1 hypothetical protein K437DRAFT_266401 [Tilletiaria anomala UBC 951]